METITPTQLADATGISLPYASQILSTKQDKGRAPSRALAIHIFRKTGLRTAPIADLTPDQIDMLEQIEPWKGQAA